MENPFHSKQWHTAAAFLSESCKIIYLQEVIR